MAGVIALTSPFLQPKIAVECRGWLAIGWQLIGYVGATAGRRTARPEGRRRYSKRCQPFNCFPSHATAAPNLSHPAACVARSEEHTSELQSLMRISYAVFCLKKKKKKQHTSK